MLTAYKDSHGTIGFVRPGDEKGLGFDTPYKQVFSSLELCEVHEPAYIGKLRCGMPLPCPLHGLA